MTDASKRWLFHFIEVTDACDWECPVCYADAGPDGGRFLSLDAAVDLGRRIRAAGGRWVSLTGGEPTLHPELEAIISALRRLGLRPLIVTNGARIAAEADLLPRLAEAGLRKVQLQFDSLRDEVCMRLRGRPCLREKHQAIERIRSAGLRLGLVATMCEYNVDEAGDLVALAASLTPMLNTLILQAALPVGRYPVGLRTVTRTEILGALLGSGRTGAVPDDFQPVPKISPWGIDVHPECGVHAVLGVESGRIRPLSQWMDVEGLRERLQMWCGGGLFGSSPVLPLGWLLRSLHPGRRIEGLRRLRTLTHGGAARGFFSVSIGSYMHAADRDEERLRRCASCTVTAAGFTGLCERSCTARTRPLLDRRAGDAA